MPSCFESGKQWQDWLGYAFDAGSLQPYPHAAMHVLKKRIYVARINNDEIALADLVKARESLREVVTRVQPREAPYCLDCTPEYRDRMIKEGRCAYPETRFLVWRDGDRVEMEGRR